MNWSAILVLAVLALANSCSTPSIIATRSVQMGDQANNVNNYELAIQHYQTYLETAPSLGTMRNPLMEADICRKLAHCYSVKGNYQQAKLYLNKALTIDENQSDNQLNIIEDYRQLGVSHIYTGKYDSALHYLDRAMQMNEGMESSLKAVKKLSIADTYLSRAQLELSMGIFKQARADGQKAVTIYDAENNVFGKMEGYLVLAKLAIATNQPDLAKAHVNRSIDAAQIEEYKLFRQYQVLADIEINLGNPEAAVLARQEALLEAKESQIIPQVIWACLRLGDAYNELGDLRKARQYYREAREMEKQMDQSSAVTPSIQMRLGDLQNAYDLFNSSGGTLGAQIALMNLLEQDLARNSADSAIELLSQSKAFFKDQGITEGVAKAVIMQSVLYKNKGDYEKALALLNETNELELRPEVAWKVQYNAALVQQKLGAQQIAEDYLVKAIEIIEEQRSTITRSEFKWHYLDQKTDVYDSYIGLLLAGNTVTQENIVKAFELNERARSRTFLDMLYGQNIVSSDVEIKREITLIKENQQLREIIEANALKGIEIADLQERISTNELELARLEEQLGATKSKFARLRSIEPVSLIELQKILDNNTAIIEFWSGNENLVSWKITRDEISYALTEITNADLHRSIARLRNLIKFGIEDRIVTGFDELNEMLATACQNVFESYKNVIVIPHGSLHFIPFDALRSSNSFVIEKAVLHYAPSASVFLYTSNMARPLERKNLLGMALGGHEIDEHLGLPGTTMEVNQLAQFYPDNNCVFEEAISESYFKEHADDYELIHVASHGVFNRTKPGRSFVLMTPTDKDDGKLMVDEIYDLNLKAKVVALSACETGLGELSEGDELIGLSRAFLYAGTSAIIVSLWRVDDLSTSIVMTRFHQLIEAGMNPDEALAIAKRDLMKANFERSNVRGTEQISWHPDLNHIISSKEVMHSSPYYWAPFIIIGGRTGN